MSLKNKRAAEDLFDIKKGIEQWHALYDELGKRSR